MPTPTERAVAFVRDYAMLDPTHANRHDRGRIRRARAIVDALDDKSAGYLAPYTTAVPSQVGDKMIVHGLDGIKDGTVVTVTKVQEAK